MKLHAMPPSARRGDDDGQARHRATVVARGGGRGRRSERAHRLQVDPALPLEGEVGLWDRSSAPRSVPNRTPEDRVAAIAALRRVRMTGPRSPRCWRWRVPRSPRCCRGWPGTLAAWSRSLNDTSEPTGGADPHRRQEAGADREGCRSPGDRQAHLPGQGRGWERVTSASTMRPVSPTWRSSATKRGGPPSAS